MSNCFQNYDRELWDWHHEPMGNLFAFPVRHCSRCERGREALESEGWTLEVGTIACGLPGLVWKRPAPDTRTACPVCGGSWKNVTSTTSGWSETVCKSCFDWALKLLTPSLEDQIEARWNRRRWAVEQFELERQHPLLPCTPIEVERMQNTHEILERSAELLKCAVNEIPERIKKVQENVSKAKKELGYKRTAYLKQYRSNGWSYWKPFDADWYDGPDQFFEERT